MFVCYPSFLPGAKVITPFPDLYRGFGLTCRPVEEADYGDTILGIGKSVIDVAAWLLTLEP